MTTTTKTTKTLGRPRKPDAVPNSVRKREQRGRDRAEGLREVLVKVPEEHAETVRQFARRLMGGATA